MNLDDYLRKKLSKEELLQLEEKYGGSVPELLSLSKRNKKALLEMNEKRERLKMQLKTGDNSDG